MPYYLSIDRSRIGGRTDSRLVEEVKKKKNKKKKKKKRRPADLVF